MLLGAVVFVLVVDVLCVVVVDVVAVVVVVVVVGGAAAALTVLATLAEVAALASSTQTQGRRCGCSSPITILLLVLFVDVGGPSGHLQQLCVEPRSGLVGRDCDGSLLGLSCVGPSCPRATLRLRPAGGSKLQRNSHVVFADGCYSLPPPGTRAHFVLVPVPHSGFDRFDPILLPLAWTAPVRDCRRGAAPSKVEGGRAAVVGVEAPITE
mmetsp:Transcript_50995/g.110446  ORF Transcript_50995/g.110446 Transcript_50995/m.110446 type:complete len:210 (-) Transcript_50995:9-638(-)